MALTDTPTQAELAEARARRAAVGQRADQIRRRRAGAIAGLVAVLVLAVAVPLALTRSNGHSQGVVTTVPPTTTHPTPTTSTATGTATTRPPGTTVNFATVSLVLPHGWTQVPGTSGVCLVPPSARATGVLLDCPGLWVVSPDGQGTPLLDSSSGFLSWHAGTGTDCPFSDPGAGSLEGSGTVVGHRYTPVGNLTAEWDEWTVSCAHGPTHHVQAWYLPTSNVLFVTAGDSPELPSILASVRHRSVDEYPVQVTAGHWAGHGTYLKIYPDGGGLLGWQVPRTCPPGSTTPCDPSIPIDYVVRFTLTNATAGVGGSWSADGTIDSDARPTLVGAHIHVTQANGKVTFVGGGFVAGTYPNGQLCTWALAGTTADRTCP